MDLFFEIKSNLPDYLRSHNYIKHFFFYSDHTNRLLPTIIKLKQQTTIET